MTDKLEWIVEKHKAAMLKELHNNLTEHELNCDQSLKHLDFEARVQAIINHRLFLIGTNQLDDYKKEGQ
jgi:hypothetical protein